MAYGAIVAAPWMPLRRKDASRALKLAGVKRGDVVYDLGSGDGRIIIAAARECGATSVGYEIAFLPYIVSYAKILSGGLRKRVRVKLRDFYHCDLSGADVIITFLLPKAMRRLKEKFERELKPGTRVVTCAWSIPGWKPDIVDKPSLSEISIFVYTKK